MSNKRIYLSPPHLSGMEEKYVTEAFATNWVAPLGPHVDAFEKELAGYVGARGAAALSSGSAALHLALRLLNIGQGDMVFCSSLTFAASCNPILYQGGEPVFIDSDPETWNMSSVALQKALEESEKKNSLPKAVIVVNLYGQSADYDPILELCNKYGIPIVEDAAESLGATYKGRASGTLGKYGVFSFNGNKIITTSGGGAIVSDDLEALERVRFWATQARDPARHYQHSQIGYNYRMSNILAGIGRAQLQVLNQRISARRRIYQRYIQAFSQMPGIGFIPEADYGRSICWLTVMLIDSSKCYVTPVDIMDALAARNIESRPVWKPMHLQPLYESYPYYPHREGISVSDGIFQQGICLPSGSSLSEEEQDYIIECILECINTKNKV